jgi:hypothetical protein
VERTELLEVFHRAKLGDVEGTVRIKLDAQHVIEPHMRDDGSRELRMLCEKGSHEQTAVAAAFDGEFVSACVTALDEVLSTGGEVIKDVLLLRQIAREMPFLTVFTTTANVGDDVDMPLLQPKKITNEKTTLNVPETLMPGTWYYQHVATLSNDTASAYIVGPVNVKDCTP